MKHIEETNNDLPLFSKVKTNDALSLDPKIIEKMVKGTLKNICSLKSDNYNVGRSDSEKDCLDNEIEMSKFTNLLQDYIISDKISKQIVVIKKKEEFVTSSKKLKIYNDNLISLKFKSAISAIKNQVILPPIRSPNGKNSSKSFDNISGDKPTKKIQSFSSNVIINGPFIEQSFHEKVKLWEQNILSPDNKKYNEKSMAAINLRQFKVDNSRKVSSKSVILPKVKRRDLSSDDILEKNNVKHILMKIDLLGRVGQNRALSGNKKFKDFIIKQKRLLDSSKVNII